jgi:hypothetical protein
MVIPIKLRLRSELFHEGQAEGKAEDVLRVLDYRAIEISRTQREQIAACTDIELLDVWFGQALDATKVTDLTGLVGEQPGDPGDDGTAETE